MIPIVPIAPVFGSAVRLPSPGLRPAIRDVAPPASPGHDAFGQRPTRRASGRRRAQDRVTRLKRRITAPPPETELPDAAPFLTQLLAQDDLQETPADPFETATRAYEKADEDPFKGLEGETLDAVLGDPQVHVDVKI
jgi:hypothetical protein